MSAELGLRIIAVAKSLEAYQSDARIANYFSATRMAGRTGLFASSLRYQSSMSYGKFMAHAAEAKLDRLNLSHFAEGWLRESGFIEVDPARTRVACNIVDYDAILKATYKWFEASDPTPEERAVLVLLEIGSQMPTK